MGYKNKEKQKEYHRQWHINKTADLPDYWRKYQRRRRREIKELINSLKTECSRCGYNKCKAALDFHHVGGIKNGRLAEASKDKWSNKKILEEISLCEVICSNCHREEHLG